MNTSNPASSGEKAMTPVPASPTEPSPTARRLIINAEQAEAARVMEQRRVLQDTLRELITDLNLPALQRLADAATSQAGQVASLPGILSETAAKMMEAQRRARRLLWWVLSTTIAAVFCMAGLTTWALVRLNKLPEAQAAFVAQMETQIAKREALTSQLAKMETEMQSLANQRASMATQVKELENRTKEARESMAQSAGLLTALGQARDQAENEIMKLQRISQAFQFRLMEGKSGMVFVEIPDTAEPFIHGGRRLIAVTTPTH